MTWFEPAGGRLPGALEREPVGRPRLETSPTSEGIGFASAKRSHHILDNSQFWDTSLALNYGGKMPLNYGTKGPLNYSRRYTTGHT